MSASPLLLPAPRAVRLTDGGYALHDQRLIVLEGDAPQALLFSARRLQAALRTHGGLTWEIVAAATAPAA